MSKTFSIDEVDALLAKLQAELIGRSEIAERRARDGSSTGSLIAWGHHDALLAVADHVQRLRDELPRESLSVG
jgi:hypothetical protein